MVCQLGKTKNVCFYVVKHAEKYCRRGAHCASKSYGDVSRWAVENVVENFFAGFAFCLSWVCTSRVKFALTLAVSAAKAQQRGC